MKKLTKFLLDWVWQLPQNICGFIYKTFMNNRIIKTIKHDDYTAYISYKLGGVSLGKYIFMYNKINERSLELAILHEYGHTKQSLYLGPLYLLVIGLPSIIHAALHKKICNSKNYYHFFTEKWANNLVKLKADSLGRLYK